MSKSARELFEELGYLCWEENVGDIAIVFSKDCSDIWFVIKEKRIDIVNYDTISMQELQAINQMCKELGWLDE